MNTNEMLQRSVTYEEAMLRNYKKFAQQAENTEVGDLFSLLTKEKEAQIEKMKSLLKRYCKP